VNSAAEEIRTRPDKKKTRDLLNAAGGDSTESDDELTKRAKELSLRDRDRDRDKKKKSSSDKKKSSSKGAGSADEQGIMP
jgi:hypothetical protein